MKKQAVMPRTDTRVRGTDVWVWHNADGMSSVQVNDDGSLTLGTASANWRVYHRTAPDPVPPPRPRTLGLAFWAPAYLGAGGE